MTDAQRDDETVAKCKEYSFKPVRAAVVKRNISERTVTSLLMPVLELITRH